MYLTDRSNNVLYYGYIESIDVCVTFVPLTAMHFVVIGLRHVTPLTKVPAPAGNVTYGNSMTAKYLLNE